MPYQDKTGMDEQAEKVFKGLECCLPETQEQAELSCAACPYDPCGVSVSLPISLIDDVRKLITAQQERVRELEEAQRVMVYQDCVKDMARLITEEDFKKADANGHIPAWIEYTPEWKNADHVWGLIDRDIFKFKYKRAWTQRPTDEQRKAVKWE